jgi:hypothetical protein
MRLDVCCVPCSLTLCAFNVVSEMRPCATGCCASHFCQRWHLRKLLQETEPCMCAIILGDRIGVHGQRVSRLTCHRTARGVQPLWVLPCARLLATPTGYSNSCRSSPDMCSATNTATAKRRCAGRFQVPTAVTMKPPCQQPSAWQYLRAHEPMLARCSAGGKATRCRVTLRDRADTSTSGCWCKSGPARACGYGGLDR